MSSLFEVNSVIDRLPQRFNTHQFAQAYRDLYPGHFAGLLRSQGSPRQAELAIRGIHALMGKHLQRHCALTVRALTRRQRTFPFLAAPVNDAFSMWQRM